MNNVANTIVSQLGNKLFAMLGGRDLLAMSSGLQFSIGSGPKRINKIRVELAADDTYTVRFYQGRGLNIKEASMVEGVYFDSLRQVIASGTGMYVSL